MIRDASAADGPLVLRLARACPCVGARIEVDWQIACENPRVPYRFYLPDEHCVLAVNTHSALLAGTPQDGRELALFLGFTGAGRLFSDGWAPPGWRREDFLRMQRPPQRPRKPGGFTEPAGLDRAPAPGEVIALLENSSGLLSPAARDRLYADLQIRRNHGCAEVYGVRGGDGALVSTAGAWALTAAEAYLACIETLPEARGRGHARALVATLAHRFSARALTLLCDETLRGFYEQLGFSLLDHRGVLASPGA